MKKFFDKIQTAYFTLMILMIITIVSYMDYYLTVSERETRIKINTITEQSILIQGAIDTHKESILGFSDNMADYTDLLSKLDSLNVKRKAQKCSKSAGIVIENVTDAFKAVESHLLSSDTEIKLKGAERYLNDLAQNYKFYENLDSSWLKFTWGLFILNTKLKMDENTGRDTLVPPLNVGEALVSQILFGTDPSGFDQDLVDSDEMNLVQDFSHFQYSHLSGKKLIQGLENMKLIVSDLQIVLENKSKLLVGKIQIPSIGITTTSVFVLMFYILIIVPIQFYILILLEHVQILTRSGEIELDLTDPHIVLTCARISHIGSNKLFVIPFIYLPVLTLISTVYIVAFYPPEFLFAVPDWTQAGISIAIIGSAIWTAAWIHFYINEVSDLAVVGTVLEPSERSMVSWLQKILKSLFRR